MQDAILIFLFLAMAITMQVAVQRYSSLRDEMKRFNVRLISDTKYEENPITANLIDYALVASIYNLTEHRGLVLKRDEFIKKTDKHEYQTNISNDVLNKYLEEAVLGKIHLMGDDLELKIPEEKN